ATVTRSAAAGDVDHLLDPGIRHQSEWRFPCRSKLLTTNAVRAAEDPDRIDVRTDARDGDQSADDEDCDREELAWTSPVTYTSGSDRARWFAHAALHSFIHAGVPALRQDREGPG